MAFYTGFLLRWQRWLAHAESFVTLGATARSSSKIIADFMEHRSGWPAGVPRWLEKTIIVKLIQRAYKYGIPVLRFHYKWANEEIEQAKHMQDTFKSIMHEMGAVVLSGEQGPETKYGLEAPGVIIHEGGTTRMGNDPRQS